MMKEDQQKLVNTFNMGNNEILKQLIY